MKKLLAERFVDFLKRENGIEEIDGLDLTDEQRDSSKADYFANNRQVIIELKSLETDTKPKVDEILDKHRDRPEFPHFYGGWDLEKILKHLPDANEIRAQIVKAITSSIQELFRKANRQIRRTTETFGLPEAKGLVIILNGNVDILSPDLITWKIRQLLFKKNPDGSSQVANVDVVLMISESHFTQLKPDLIGFPCLVQPNPATNNEIARQFTSDLIQRWARFNDAEYLSTEFSDIKELKKLNIESVADRREASKRLIPRHEAWRRQYRQTPYFRSYDDDKMRWMFQMIMEELTPGFLKGASDIEKDKTGFWIEVFTHFLEEVNHRGIDMKIFSPFMKKHGNQIEALMNERYPANE